MKFTKSEIPHGLLKLAELFPVPLYAVGGFVRDTLLGYHTEDIDITAAATPDEVKEFLSKSEFTVKEGSKKLLTLIICDGERSYEFTSFRYDSYKSGHTPETVTHCTDINVDAARRDFTVNAIYYDIKGDEIVDPLNGLADLGEGVLRTTRSPHEVFSEDGLRLMRLVRFAAALNFTPTEDVLSAAKENRNLIKEISCERIRVELDKILVGDLAYGVKEAHYNGLLMLDKIGILELILPEITLGKGMEQRSDYHKYDVFGHIMHTVLAAAPEIRLAALMHDVAKPYIKLLTGRYAGHDSMGGKMTEQILQRLKYSTAVIEETVRLVENHMFNLECNAKTNTVRLFVLKNQDIVEKLAKLLYADSKGSGMDTATNKRSADILLETYNKMREEKVPFSVTELLVKGTDLIDIPELPENKRGACLNSLLRERALENTTLITREKQLDYIKTYIRRSKQWSTE